MSKIIPNKEHSWTALIFCFHLKKTGAEPYWLLRKTYGENSSLRDTCERWFWCFKGGNFEVTDKKHVKSPKQFEDAELRELLDEDVRGHKNNSPSNWALDDKLFLIGYKRWERFRRPIDGYHLCWTTGKGKNAKIHVTFCSLGTRRSRFCIV